MAVEPKPVVQVGGGAVQAARAQLDAKPSWRKIAVLGVVVGGLVAIAYLSPWRAYVSDLREVSVARIRSLGMVGPAVVTMGGAILVAIGFPRLALCVIAGMALGFWSGLLWAQLGTLLGNYAIFLIAGSTGRTWAQHYLAKRHRLRGLIQEEGTWGVILARQIPVPGLIVNLACGLFGVRHRHFLLGTAIGQLPEAIPCTLIGAGALEPSFAKSAGVISLAVAVSVLVWVGLRRLARARGSRGGPP